LQLNSTQVRKDIAITNFAGKPKLGYKVSGLISAIESFLGWNCEECAVLIGCGHFGQALLGYKGFLKSGLNIVATFDNDITKIGFAFHGRIVESIENLKKRITSLNIKFAILTVPASAAQEITDILVDAGIKAIWNFTSVCLNVTKDCLVEDVHLVSSLAVLSSRLKQFLQK